MSSVFLGALTFSGALAFPTQFLPLFHPHFGNCTSTYRMLITFFLSFGRQKLKKASNHKGLTGLLMNQTCWRISTLM